MIITNVIHSLLISVVIVTTLYLKVVNCSYNSGICDVGQTECLLHVYSQEHMHEEMERLTTRILYRPAMYKSCHNNNYTSAANIIHCDIRSNILLASTPGRSSSKRGPGIDCLRMR